MPSKKKPLFLRLTDSHRSGLEQAAGGNELSEYVRSLIEYDLTAKGIAFERMPQHGGSPIARQPKPRDDRFKWHTDENHAFILKDHETGDSWSFSRNTMLELMDIPPAAMRHLIMLVAVMSAGKGDE